MSANRGVAPAITTAEAVATNDIDGTNTSSPGPIPAISMDKCRAAVPLLTKTTSDPPNDAANSLSNRAVTAPMAMQPEEISSRAAPASASPT